MPPIFRWFSKTRLMGSKFTFVSEATVRCPRLGFRKTNRLSTGILLMLVLAMAACGGGIEGGVDRGNDGGIEGKFVSESNPNDYLQLRGDGSFTQEEGGRTFSGTYESNDNKIILTLNPDAAGEGTIFEVVLIDSDGEQWGKQVPNDFTFTLYQGQERLGAETLNFSDLQGKPVILNFWAGLCGPCRAELPEFQEFYDEYQDRVVLLGIDVGQFTLLGNQDDAKALLQVAGVTYPSGFTEDPAIMRNFKVLGIPTTVFVSSQGEIFQKYDGVLTLKKLSEIADEMLGQEAG